MTVIAKAAGKRFEVTKDGKRIGFHKTMEAAIAALGTVDVSQHFQKTRYPAKLTVTNNRRD